MKYLYENFWLHTLSLVIVFLFCVWYGASYYFDVFSESYVERLQERVQEKDNVAGKYGTNLYSFLTSSFFFCSALVSLCVILSIANKYAI